MLQTLQAQYKTGPDDWEQFPTAVLWMYQYAPRIEKMYSMALSTDAVGLQQLLIGRVFLGDTDDLRYLRDYTVTSQWFGVLSLCAAFDAVFALEGIGDRDLDICEIRDAFVNADCLGERSYQLPIGAWVDMANKSVGKDIEDVVDDLESFYRAEFVRIDLLKRQGKL